MGHLRDEMMAEMMAAWMDWTMVVKMGVLKVDETAREKAAMLVEK